jgi:uncharacterized FAD-dependent dehydrogenase
MKLFIRLQNSALAGMEFQKSIEQMALAGETQGFLRKRMIDFTQSRVSSKFKITSFLDFLGLLGQLFPGFLTQILREGLEFGKSMKGYLTNEAIYAQNQEPLRLFVFPEIL